MTDKDTEKDIGTEELQEIIQEQAPQSAEEHVELYAYLKGTHQGTTQKTYAEAVGISPRTLRSYISNNREAYDLALADAEEDALNNQYDPNKMTDRELSEEDLDAFVQGMIKSATSAQATPRDRALFVEFFGLKAEDIVNLSQSKNKSLKWLIRNNLPTIQNYMDVKELGVALEESKYIDQGDRDSKGNRQNFIDADISDESFKLELIQWGLVFLSLYNNTAHPDLPYLMQAVRLDKIQKGDTAPRLNKGRLKRYASAKKWVEAEDKKPSDSQLIAKLTEAGFNKVEAEGIVKNKKKAQDTVKPPDIDKDDIEQRASQYADQLEILLSTEDMLYKMMQDSK